MLTSGLPFSCESEINVLISFTDVGSGFPSHFMYLFHCKKMVVEIC
uniref:Uncharacterized protein n=1 Tax=Ciona intestinalis TaxID=7719 RepID=H2XNZ9_CIOIN